MKYLLLILLEPTYSLADSVCFGTTSNGKLDNGVKLPSRGKNFVSYSLLAQSAGRTYVHSEVKNIVVSAYKELESTHPKKVFKYAETGFKNGSKFKPHKTHQNGLSVDFMTPVMKNGKSTHLPTNMLNRLGYDIEFDSTGKYKQYTIDYQSLAAHIVSLHKQAKSRGYDLWRVIFDPKLQPNLFKTKYANYLKSNIKLSKSVHG